MSKKYRNWLEFEIAAKAIVSEQFGLNPKEVQLSTHFINDLGTNSLDTIELIMEMETEFNISIPDEYAEKWQTLADGIQGCIQLYPREMLSLVDTKILSFQLREDGTIEDIVEELQFLKNLNGQEHLPTQERFETRP